MSVFVLAAIVFVLIRAVKNHKKTDITPYLFIWTVVFLLIANVALLTRVVLRLKKNKFVADRTGPAMISFVFVTTFGI